MVSLTGQLMVYITEEMYRSICCFNSYWLLFTWVVLDRIYISMLDGPCIENMDMLLRWYCRPPFARIVCVCSCLIIDARLKLSCLAGIQVGCNRSWFSFKFPHSWSQGNWSWWTGGNGVCIWLQLASCHLGFLKAENSFFSKIVWSQMQQFQCFYQNLHWKWIWTFTFILFLPSCFL